MSLKSITLLFYCCVLLIFQPAAAWTDRPAKGGTLPAFTLAAPSLPADISYLGITPPSFTLGDVAGDILLVEVLGVYCPRCREQAPLLNALQARLEKRGLDSRVKLLGIAAGATLMEVEMIRQEWRIKHPVLTDEKFEVHKLLGEPKTPFVILLDHGGRVVYLHEGVIRDIDVLYDHIKSLLP